MRKSTVTIDANELEALRRDAARYRALRHSLSGCDGCSHTQMPRISVPLRDDMTYTPDGLDAAIDAVIASMKTHNVR